MPRHSYFLLAFSRVFTQGFLWFSLLFIRFSLVSQGFLGVFWSFNWFLRFLRLTENSLKHLENTKKTKENLPKDQQTFGVSNKFCREPGASELFLFVTEELQVGVEGPSPCEMTTSQTNRTYQDTLRYAL